MQVLAIFSGFNYGILYIMLSTFAGLWTTAYHERVNISGLHYIALALGEIAGSQISGRVMDRIFIRLRQRRNGETAPEFHIPLMLPSAILASAGLFLYGWAAQARLHWSVVDIGALLACLGMQAASQPKQAYIIDAFPEYASSATAASQFVSSLTAFAFPLFAPRMYKAMGYGWGNTLLGIAGLAIGVPAPLLIWRYGPKLRAKAHMTF